MSKDIRSFFTQLGGGRKKEDKSTDAIQPPKKRGAVLVISDSDDDDILPVSAKKLKTANGGTKSKVAKKVTPVPTKKLTPERKPVNAMDIFGSKKIQRSTETTAQAKKVEVHKDLGLKVTFDDMADEDFEATCQQLDAAAAIANASFESAVKVYEGNTGFDTSEGKSKIVAKQQEKESNLCVRSNGNTVNLKEEEKIFKKKKEDQNENEHEKLKGVKENASIIEDKVDKKEKKEIEIKKDSSTVKVDEKEDQRDKKKIESKKDSPTVKVDKKEDQIDKKKIESKKDRSTGKVDKKEDQRDSKKNEDDDEYSWMKNHRARADRSKEEKKDKKNVESTSDSATVKVDKEKRAGNKKEDDDEDDEFAWMKDPAERRRVSAIGYQRYLNREGPKHLGLKEIPKGRPDCLKGLVFVVTGVLDSMERDDAEALIQECGGKVTKSLSRNTSYIVVGEDAGPAKVNKAEKLGTGKLDEDGLFELIRTKSGITAAKVPSPQTVTSQQCSSRKENESGKQETKKKQDTPKGSKREEVKKADTQKVSKDRSLTKEDSRKVREASSSVTNEDTRKVHEVTSSVTREDTGKTQEVSSSARKEDVKKIQTSPLRAKEDKITKIQEASTSVESVISSSQMWVDKYRPTNTKQIIGQQGDSSNVKKLSRWLENWQSNQFGGKVLRRPDMYARNDDGGFFKAALLSGPPGVGKTTTAHLVCKELGFDMVEFNASDTRSKRLLHEEVSELLSSKSLYEFFRGGSGVTARHVLVMDEVDGMAGNEDRGGIAALIQLIKTAKVPVICMCNDAAHQKMRSLVGNCFHLRFNKPKVEQIRGALMSVCFKEGLKLSPTQLSEMIVASSQDVRQVLHSLSMCSPNEDAAAAGGSQPTGSQGQPAAATKQIKNIRLGPFDVVKKVFSADDHKTMSIGDKVELFFFDYSIGPLFVQQNYLNVTPHAAKNNRRKHLDLLADAADSMCWGDLADKSIRRNNAWSLLPTQGMFASVIPGDLMSGHLSAMIEFPAWLGKNSQRNKQQRLLTELHMHTQLRASCDKSSLNMDYLPFLRDAVTRPLIADGLAGVQAALDVLLAYNLLRTDIDSIMEVSVWRKGVDPWARVDSKVKAALTRAYKNAKPNLPYSTDQGFSKKKAGGGGGGGTEFDMDSPDGDDGGDGEEESDDDIAADARIKVKQQASAKPATSKGKAAASKSAVNKRGGASGSSSGSSPGTAPAKKSRGRGKSK